MFNDKLSLEQLAMKSALICLTALLLSLSIGTSQSNRKDQPSMTVSVFGKLPDNRDVLQYTLVNRAGMSAQVINYGATITSLRVPDRTGKMDDVVLGYDTLQGYMDGTAYFGAIVGRYGNRIGKGQFSLDGKQYKLTINDGENHLHGGKIGFNRVLWQAKPLSPSAIELQYVSKDGEEGYPGTVTLKVTYSLTDNNELRIRYEGTTDKPTILNPTQHSYFNLSGSFTNTILDHVLMIEADRFTPIDKGLITTGKLAEVANTPLDFRTPITIGVRINDAYEQLAFGKGYDHNWVLRGKVGQLRKAVELYEPKSGRLMTMQTDQPGVQFYSGNFLNGTPRGKNGVAYQSRTGLCLEAQAYPDTPNKPQFPSVTLRPGQVYHQTTIYQFSTK
jgi:aldose 1-epimerase